MLNRKIVEVRPIEGIGWGVYETTVGGSLWNTFLMNGPIAAIYNALVFAGLIEPSK